MLRAVSAFVAILALAACGRNFQSAAWRASAGCVDDDRRLGMVAKLERDVLRVGMSEADVIAQLGEPEVRARDGLVYCLGRNFLDYDEYVIELGPDGKVTAFRQVQG
jgi:hypothetical protein